MFGGGLDRDLPEHIDNQVISIPCHNLTEDSFHEKITPILTA